MGRAVAINVGANTSLPGFRGPIHADGRFEYVPIPEREPVCEPVPTYGDLDLSIEVPDGLLDRRVHLDPSFEEYPRCEAYTYGDEHAVKARSLSELSADDVVLFYATLSTVGEDPEPGITPEWGAYVIGSFVLAHDPVSGEEYMDLSAAERAPFSSNAHCKREVLDAEVLLAGDPDRSGLRERALRLSAGRGSDPNRSSRSCQRTRGRDRGGAGRCGSTGRRPRSCSGWNRPISSERAVASARAGRTFKRLGGVARTDATTTVRAAAGVDG